VVGSLLHGSVCCVQGAPSPLEVGVSFLVLNAFGVSFLALCLHTHNIYNQIY
jgi:hypothetical protein